MNRPTAADLLDTPGALLSPARTYASSATSAAALSTRLSRLPIVSLPRYSRPLIRVADYFVFLEQHTFDGRTRVR